MRIIYPPTIAWEGADVFQRPQQLIKAFAKLGHQAVFVEKYRFDPNPYTIKSGVEFWGENTPVPEKYESTVLWVTHAPHFRLKEHYQADVLVFDYIDECVEEFAAWTVDLKEAMEAADIITVVSSRLLRIIKQEFPSKPVVLLPNAADYDHFKDARKLPCPADMSHLTGPIIGFMGTIQSWIDMKLLVDLARMRPDWNLVLIGPFYTHDTFGMGFVPNIKLLGRKRYDELPAYVGQFDVATVPFQVRDMTNSSSPIKMYEYLAAGLPVVSTPIEEAERCVAVDTGATAEEWAEIIEQRLAETFGWLYRQEFAKNESWESRALLALAHINEAMNK